MKDNVFYLKLADDVTTPEQYLPRGIIIDDLCIITGKVRINRDFQSSDIIAYLPDEIVPKFNRFIPCFYQNGSTFDKPKMMAIVCADGLGDDGQDSLPKAVGKTVTIAQGGVYHANSYFYFTGHAYCLA